jgi:hypothetical protein
VRERRCAACPAFGGANVFYLLEGGRLSKTCRECHSKKYYEGRYPACAECGEKGVKVVEGLCAGCSKGVRWCRRCPGWLPDTAGYFRRGAATCRRCENARLQLRRQRRRDVGA